MVRHAQASLNAHGLVWLSSTRREGAHCWERLAMQSVLFQAHPSWRWMIGPWSSPQAEPQPFLWVGSFRQRSQQIEHTMLITAFYGVYGILQRLNCFPEHELRTASLPLFCALQREPAVPSLQQPHPQTATHLARCQPAYR